MAKVQKKSGTSKRSELKVVNFHAAGKRDRIKKSPFLVPRFICGVSILLIIRNGIHLLGCDTQIEYMITGIVLILATSLNYRFPQNKEIQKESQRMR